jgi:CO/xanthine dehydrogenase Mo-binding subunit
MVDDATEGIDWQAAHCHQCHMVEVEVDPDIGKVYVTNCVLVNDVGKAMQPTFVNAQQYGGAGMGISRSNQEEVYYDWPTGMKLNDNLAGYCVHVMNDIGPMDCHIVETQQGYSAYGIVGIGEDLGAVLCTVTGNAVYNAIGKWVEDFPTTPDRILLALGKG